MQVSVVMDQFLKLMLHCGMPPHDVDFLNGQGTVVHQVLMAGKPRSTLFTGSQRTAEMLSCDLNGKVHFCVHWWSGLLCVQVYLEDAGFDWKILGPDVSDMDFVAWVCDQDAYAASGQKCSAQSLLFMHENWMQAGLEKHLRERAARRNLHDLTVGPVLTWTTAALQNHIQKLLALPGDPRPYTTLDNSCCGGQGHDCPLEDSR